MDHHLLPEATSLDILEDIRHFWAWLHDKLPSQARTWSLAQDGAQAVTVDMSRLALHGESSGGYLAVHCCLQFPAHMSPDAARVRCVISSCGSIDVAKPYFVIPGPKRILGMPPVPVREAARTIREYLASASKRPGVVRTRTDPNDLWGLVVAVITQGYYPRLLQFLKNDDLNIVKVLETEKAPQLPPLWIMHGLDDTVVSDKSAFLTCLFRKVFDTGGPRSV